MSEDASRGGRMVDAIVAIGADPDPDVMLRRLVEWVADLAGADSVVLALVASLGRPRQTFVHPEDLDSSDGPADPLLPVVSAAAGASLVVPVRAGRRSLGTLVLERRAEVPFDETEDGLARSLARAAGLIAESARSAHRSERRHRWLEASARIITVLEWPLDLDSAMGRVAEDVLSTAGAVAAAVVQVGAPGEAPSVVGAAGADAETLRSLVGALEDRIRTAHTHGRVAAAATPDGAGVLVAPLRARVAEGGVLLVVHELPIRTLDAEEAGLLTGYADHVSLALDRVQALQDRQALMLVADRDRIARDLHDQVIQRIFATGLQLEGVRRTAESAATRERIGAAIADLDATISEIRTTIFELQRSEGASVRGQVADVVSAYAPLLGFSPAVRFVGPVDNAVPDAVTEQLVAVLRESLSNVRRHSGAREVRVEVEVEVGTGGGQVCLVVVDDGVGVPAERTESGLRNLRSRARELGGSCVVTANADGDRGTRVTWRVPYASG